MDKKPLISIIMSVYNDEKHIKEALDSLFSQTLDDFEIIIVDDCSTDRTVQIIERYEDERIHLLRNEGNKGLTRNLNKAIEYIKGTYVARMDGDDICYPERLEKQVKYLEEHKKVMLISCRTKMFGEENLISRIKGTPEELKAMMLIRPVLAHPGFLMRAELLTEYGMRYDESFLSAQDYDFAVRTAQRFAIAVTPEILLRYRVHKKQVSSSKTGEQMKNADRVRKYQLNRMGVKLGEEMEEIHRKWAKEEKCEDIEVFYRTVQLIKIIIESNKKTKIYEDEVLENVLKKLLYLWIIRNKSMRIFIHLFSICEWNMKNLFLFLGQATETVRSKL